MYRFSSVIVILVLFLCGCSKSSDSDFISGTGDVGKFILEEVLKRGGRSISQNDLPVIQGEWKYFEDENGVIIHLDPKSSGDLEKFLNQAFGKPANEASATTTGGKLGWYAPNDIGVLLQFGFEPKHAFIILLKSPQPKKETRKLSSI
jgi:hypothetical protein